MKTAVTFDLFAQAEHLDELFGHELAFPELPERAPNPAAANFLGGLAIFVLGLALVAFLSFLSSLLAPDVWLFHNHC